MIANVHQRPLSSLILTLTHTCSHLAFESYYSESREIWRQPSAEARMHAESPEHVERSLLSYILEHCPKSSPAKTIELIDKYCQQNWMMNFGPQKSRLFHKITEQNNIRKVMEIGTYCGYSSLVLSQCNLAKESKIISFEKDKSVADIARKIIAHSGVLNVEILPNIFQDSQQMLRKEGPFDLIFLDHDKERYLEELHLLIKFNLIQSGTFVVANNVIYSGASAYLEYFKNVAPLESSFASVLHHTYDAYTDIPNGILVSRKL